LFAGLPGKFVTDPNTAQMIKYGSNALLATRVAFINELSQICERLGADIADVSRALLMDPRLGSGYLSAGIGFAGPCLPKDIAALQATATSVGLKVPLISSVPAQNASQLAAVTRRITELLDGGGSQVGVKLANADRQVTLGKIPHSEGMCSCCSRCFLLAFQVASVGSPRIAFGRSARVWPTRCSTPSQGFVGALLDRHETKSVNLPAVDVKPLGIVAAHAWRT